MKSSKTDLEARVWQRVQQTSGSMQERQTLQRLISQLEADAAFLRSQSRHATSGQTLMIHLLEEFVGQAACLRGIHTFSTGNPMGKFSAAQTTSSLKQCYHHAQERLKEYLLRSADFQFAPVYAQLAEETREHCRRIVQLAGGRKG